MSSSSLSRALRESREMVALATDQDGLTIWCSAGFSMMSGYLESELIGRKPGSVLQSPQSDSLVVRRIGMHLRAGLPVSAELLNQHKSGSEYWTQLQILPLHDEGGTLSGFLSLQRDISAEVQRRHERQEALHNRMWLVFSHEVRTPINSLCNLIDLMAAEPSFDEAARRELLHMARAAAGALQGMVNELLDSAKLDAQEHQQAAALSAVELSQLMSKLKDMTQGYPKRWGVQLAFQCDPVDVPLMLREAPLLRVLMNLTVNALKFTERGQVEVSAARMKQVDDPHFELLRFSVTDTGIGIAAADQARVLMPFEQVAASQQEGTGTGLGLALCDQILRGMGSQLRLYSEPGRGSCFWFDLVIEKSHAATSEALPAPAPALTSAQEQAHTTPAALDQRPLRGLWVLAVDDNPLGLQVAQRQLKRLGAQVTSADSGSAALEAVITGETPDIVLVDLHMPGLDGFATAQGLRQIARMRDVPIIALSASVDPQDTLKAERASMSGFIRKPFTLETLTTGVLEAAAQRRQSGDERIP